MTSNSEQLFVDLYKALQELQRLTSSEHLVKTKSGRTLSKKGLESSEIICLKLNLRRKNHTDVHNLKLSLLERFEKAHSSEDFVKCVLKGICNDFGIKNTNQAALALIHAMDPTYEVSGISEEVQAVKRAKPYVVGEGISNRSEKGAKLKKLGRLKALKAPSYIYPRPVNVSAHTQRLHRLQVQAVKTFGRKKQKCATTHVAKEKMSPRVRKCAYVTVLAENLPSHVNTLQTFRDFKRRQKQLTLRAVSVSAHLDWEKLKMKSKEILPKRKSSEVHSEPEKEDGQKHLITPIIEVPKTPPPCSEVDEANLVPSETLESSPTTEPSLFSNLVDSRQVKRSRLFRVHSGDRSCKVRPHKCRKKSYILCQVCDKQIRASDLGRHKSSKQHEQCVRAQEKVLTIFQFLFGRAEEKTSPTAPAPTYNGPVIDKLLEMDRSRDIWNDSNLCLIMGKNEFNNVPLTLGEPVGCSTPSLLFPVYHDHDYTDSRYRAIATDSQSQSDLVPNQGLELMEYAGFNDDSNGASSSSDGCIGDKSAFLPIPYRHDPILPVQPDKLTESTHFNCDDLLLDQIIERICFSNQQDIVIQEEDLFQNLFPTPNDSPDDADAGFYSLYPETTMISWNDLQHEDNFLASQSAQNLESTSVYVAQEQPFDTNVAHVGNDRPYDQEENCLPLPERPQTPDLSSGFVAQSPVDCGAHFFPDFPSLYASPTVQANYLTGFR